MQHEMPLRSLVKAVTWQVAGVVLLGLSTAYLAGGSADPVAPVALLTLVAFVAYYVHERLWEQVRFGRASSQAQPRPFVLWFTGLPCSGKSTLAERFVAELRADGIQVEHLDGDAVRGVLPSKGFSKEDRNNHVRQMGFIASRLEANGVNVVASFVSPYRESRDFSRTLCNNFFEIWISTPVEECERRDVKGMYKKARAGEMANFTGIDDPYEAPEKAEVVMDTTHRSIEDCLSEVRQYLRERGYTVSAAK
ncbi:MAG: adenylyl-sulfate kinase [Bdellovibrionales bacterium]|nr:adenylyl-sulfate kinase [Bdellovibrionales bacterium]